MLAEQFPDIFQGYLQRGCILLGGQCGGSAGSLSHCHARGLYAKTRVGQPVAANGSAGDNDVAAVLWNQRSQWNRWDHTLGQGLGLNATAGVQVYGVEGEANCILEHAAGGIVFMGYDRFTQDTVAFATCGLRLHMYQAL